MNCAIVGGGASALMAAIVALRDGVDVTIYEKNSKLARKILISGNGRCNITNQNLSSIFYQGDSAFVGPILSQFDFNKCKNFFSDIGLEIVTFPNGRSFPVSLQSSSVVDVLLYEIQKLGGKIKLSCEVKEIDKKDRFKISFHDKIIDFFKTDYYDKVLLCTGSNAHKLGSNNAYDLAKNFNHQLKITNDAIVALNCKENTKKYSGTKLEAIASVWVDDECKVSYFGDVLIDDLGLSGSAILYVSHFAVNALSDKKSVKITLDCMPNLTKQEVVNCILNIVKKDPNKPNWLILNSILHKKLALLILEKLHLQDKILNQKEIKKIAFLIKNLIFTPISSRGTQFAAASSGGVNTDFVDKNTLESKIVKNLYFAGELLDVCGFSGGYNLHFAWASGFVSGKNLAKS